MSRAYRITLKAAEARRLRGEDAVSTKLELLNILPPEQTAQLLKQSLQSRGFEEDADGKMVRRDDTLKVTVDLCNGEVVVQSSIEKEVNLEVEKEGIGYDDVGADRETIKDRVKEQLQQALENESEEATAKLNEKASEALEKELEKLTPEISKIVNEVTRESLKQKARTVGKVQEIHEDANSGDLTIKLEV